MVLAEQISSLTDLSNPFTVYLYVMIVALLIRARLVLLPLIRVYKRYTITISNQKVGRIPIRGILSNLRLFKRETSISGIEGFLATEATLAAAPMLAALGIRLSMGSPTIDVWDSTTLLVLFVVFGIWLLVHIKRSLDMKSSIGQLEKWYSHPVIVSSGLNTAIWSRRRLVEMSKIEIPEYIEYPETTYEKMIVESQDDGKGSFDFEAAKHNLKQIGEKVKITTLNATRKVKQSAKDVSAKATMKLDAHVQKRVDSVIGFSSSRVVSFMGHLIVVLGPLAAIYGLN